jgi:hypothetical protein
MQEVKSGPHRTHATVFRVLDDTAAEVGQVEHAGPLAGWVAGAPDGWSSVDHSTPFAACHELERHLYG